MKKSLRLPLVFASLLLALPAHAAEREWIPHRKLVDSIKLDKMLNPQWLAHDAQIWTSLPKGEKMRMGFDLGAVLPETTQWRYASDAQNHVRLKFDADMLKENLLVEWSTRSFEAEIDD